MLENILLQIPQELLAFAAIAVAVFLLNYGKYGPRRWRKRFYIAKNKSWKDRGNDVSRLPNLSDYMFQLKCVQESTYRLKAPMHKGEYAIFRILEEYFADLRQGHRVIPQLSLGAIMKCSTKNGFISIAAKRLDYGIIDKWGTLVVAIEYNGSGHYIGNGPQSDAIKRLALNKAGVHIIEIIPEDTPQVILNKVKLFLSK